VSSVALGRVQRLLLLALSSAEYILLFGVSAVHTGLSAWANRLQQVLHVLLCCVRKGFCAAAGMHAQQIFHSV